MSVGLSLLAGFWLRPFTYRMPYLLFTAAILISLLYGGRQAGIVSTILSVLLAKYFFFPPYGRFSFDLTSLVGGIYFCLFFWIICWLIDAKWERVEGERRESEERVRLFVEHAPAALAMFDREMRYLHVSRRWRADYGLGDRDLIGVSHYEIFPEVPEHWKQAHRRALGGDVLREENDRFDRADGSVQWIRWETRPWRDSKGMIGGIVIFAEDVSERKQAADVRERLAAVVDSSDDAIIAKTVDGTINAWNSGAEKVFGYSYGGAVGKPIQMLLPPERAYEESDILARIARGESVEHFETVRIRKDGARIDVSVTISPIRDITGAIVGASKIARDITERKQANEKLRQSEDRNRDLVEHSQDLICTHDLSGKMLSANPSAARILGYSVAELLAIPMREIVAPEFRGQFDQYLERIRKHGADKGFLSVLTRSGERRIWEYDNTLRTEGVESPVVRGMARDVTEKMRAEHALLESEEKFRTLADCVPQMIWISTPDGLNTYCNRRWVEYTGMSLEESSGKGWSTPYHDDDKQRAWDAWNHAVATGERYHVESRIRAADGSYRWFLMQVEPLRDASGSVVKWFGSCTDIEDMKEAEIALRENERVVDGLEEMILVVNRDFHYVLANHAFLDFRGMSAEQVVGRSVEQVVGRETFATHVKEKMEECFRGNAVEYEMNYDFPSRGRRDLHVSYFPIEGPKGVERIACVLQDITDRKRVEEALFKSEERFSKAFRNNPLAITISTEAEGRYLDVNDAFLNLLGYLRKDVIGRTAGELHFWSEPLDREEMLRHLQEEEKVAKHHTRYRTAKGEIREAEVWAESIELDGQRCILGITRDVTEMKKLEAQFRQAQKMEAVGRLAGGVAHDFNNILGIVMGYSDIALGEIPTDTRVKKYLTEIKKASQRAALITRQLLAFSRQQVVFPKMLDLNDVVQNVTTMFLRLVGEDIEFEFRPGTAIGSIKADPGQIEQILMNLVVNARDAMPTGGKITIETGTSELDEHYTSRHAGAHEGKHVVLKVSDTGSGMDETTRSQIFEPFFTTKAPGKGTGLGLSTVYGIVKQSEGDISVYSEPGKGTTFKIYFPRLREKAEELGSHREEAEPPRGSETILVVEDDKILRGLAVKLLQEGGYHVIEAEDAENALKILSSTGVEVDLLLTDIVMPGQTGVELLAEAKRIRQNLRAVFMSGYAGDLVTQHGVLVQEHSFLEKPFTKRALLTKVYSVLHGET